MTDSERSQDEDKFLEAASHDRERGIVAEFLGFMRENKMWWMMPILLVLALVGVMLVLGSNGALAAFIYPLF
jgi:hypothetical protein